MRLEGDAAGTLAAAAEAGIRVFDTAHAYGRSPGENERLLAAALRLVAGARVITKGGMTRSGGGWVPDGRAKAIRADCDASATALAGMPIDLYLLHAPDPRTEWGTSVRALGRVLEDGAARHVGLSNVNRTELDEACTLAPIAAVEVALSWADDGAVRGGVVERCEELGIAVIAHSPLGGPRRAARIERDQQLAAVAAAHGASAAEVALAWLLALSPAIVAIPGARRPETVRSAARAAALSLTDDDRATLSARTARRRRAPGAVPAATEVVIVMGIPGAGKSRIAGGYLERGYVRFNRDDRGGSLADLAASLDDALAGGHLTRAVLDNTYLSRASRNRVIEVAADHGAPVRCVWVDTPLEQAQVNLVERLLDRFDGLPTPEEVRAVARREPGVMLPTSQMRAVRELEPPALEEGFAAVERIAFERVPRSPGEGVAACARGATLIAASALEGAGVAAELDPQRPVLIFDWRPGGTADELSALAERVPGLVETAVCPHGAGPPSCWCRPPLPGLPLAFARAHLLDLRQSTVIGTSTAHRAMARVLGCDFRPI